MTAPRRQRTARKVEVGSGAIAGTVGAGFGAAKLRDSFQEDYPKKAATAASTLGRAAVHAGLSPAKVGRLHDIAHAGKPGFIPLAVGSTAAAISTGAKKYRQHVSKADHKKEGLALRRRAHAAISPPPVPRKPVDSSAIASAGYQSQTHRLAIEMKSKPGEPYVYKLKPKKAAAFEAAPSKGSFYSHQIRGQAKHAKGYSPADRARLFANPPAKVSKSDFGAELGKIPRVAHIKGIGKVRVLHYHGNGHFMVLDRTDSQRLVHRDQLGFRKTVSKSGMSPFGVQRSS